jgi:hypothetical protein
MTAPQLRPALLLLCLGLATGCGKKAQPAATPQPTTTATTVEVDTAAAQRLGFASYLPADTAALLSTTQLRAHLERWAGTDSYAQLLRYLADKTPPQSAESTPSSAAALPSLELARTLLTADTLLALGSGNEEALRSSLELAGIWTQLQAQSTAQHWYAGSSSSALFILAEDSTLKQQFLKTLQQWQMPRLTVALNVSKAAEWLGLLFPEQLRSQWHATARMGQVSGTHPFHFVEGTVETILPTSTLQQWQQQLPPGPAAALAQQMVDILSTKPLSIGYGVVSGHAVLFIGAQRPTFTLAHSLQHSVLSQPECQPALHGGDSLLLHGYATAATRKLWSESAVLTQLTEGWLKGTSSGDADEKARAQPVQQALRALAKAGHHAPHPSAIGWALQWKETPTLITTQSLPQATAPAHGLKFSFLTHAEHSAASWAGRDSALAQPLLALVTTAAAAKAEPSAAEWAAEMLARLQGPAFGTEQALLLTQPPQEGAWPQAAAFSTVADRALLSRDWQEAAVTEQLRSHFPQLQLTAPEHWQRYATTFFSYALPTGMDASPSAGIGEQHLILSSSRELTESLARSILTAQRADPEMTSSWRIHLPRLQQLLPQLWPHSATVLAHPAFALIKELRGSTEQHQGQLRSQLEVELRSPQRFD